MADSGVRTSGTGRMLRSLYEAAMREVTSDVPAALVKYQPDWVIAFPSGRARGPARQARPRGAARKG